MVDINAGRRAGGDLSQVGALLADPARAAILAALMGGEALPAGELARHAAVTPATASSHLARLLAARWVTVEPNGRQRRYRLASPEIAALLEYVACISTPAPIRSLRAAEEAAALRAARTCYDHLAGVLGVALTQTLVERGVLTTGAEGYAATPTGAARLEEFGLDLADARRRRRLFAPHCLDWSERQHHLAGALGAALANRLFELGWIARTPVNRAVRVTNEGQAGLRETFGLSVN